MQEPNVKKRHHLVSNGYQKNFAHQSHLAVIDVAGAQVSAARRSTKVNWCIDDFLTVFRPDGEVDITFEDELMDLERTFLNQVRDIRAPRLTPSQRRALDQLVATHLVRSESFVQAHDHVLDTWRQEYPEELLARPTLPGLFEVDRGRPPRPGELERLIRDQQTSMIAEGDMTINAMRNSIPTIEAILARSQVHLMSVAEILPGLAIGDVPAVHADRTTGRIGFRDGLAVGDADLIVIPIRRRLLALYTRSPLQSFEVRTKSSVQCVNALLCQAARVEVACHPDDSLDLVRVVRNLDRYPLSGFGVKPFR